MVSKLLNSSLSSMISLKTFLPCGKHLIVGDFNLHMDIPSKSDVAQFATLLAEFNLQQHVDGPTHKDGHCLDLVITQEGDSLVQECDRSENLYSDHRVVQCKIDCSKPIQQKIVSNSRNYHKMDTEAFNGDLVKLLKLSLLMVVLVIKLWFIIKVFVMSLTLIVLLQHGHMLSNPILHGITQMSTLLGASEENLKEGGKKHMILMIVGHILIKLTFLTSLYGLKNHCITMRNYVLLIIRQFLRQ